MLALRPLHPEFQACASLATTSSVGEPSGSNARTARDSAIFLFGRRGLCFLEGARLNGVPHLARAAPKKKQSGIFNNLLFR